MSPRSGVSPGGYYVDVPIDTPIGAAITAVVMTLIVISILNYFYHRLKERQAAGGQLTSETEILLLEIYINIVIDRHVLLTDSFI